MLSSIRKLPPYITSIYYIFVLNILNVFQSFKITRLRDRPAFLPSAHTCFNQLVLPDYPDRETLEQKLFIALSNAEGFGLE